VRECVDDVTSCDVAHHVRVHLMNRVTSQESVLRMSELAAYFGGERALTRACISCF
jgi:hypothetical protein